MIYGEFAGEAEGKEINDMATLTKRMRGGSLMFEIQFCVDRRRKTIPLGKRYTEKTARELLEVVEALLYCQVNGIEVPGKKTIGWIESASPELQDKLAKAGLIVQPPRKTTGELWSEFLRQKKDINPDISLGEGWRKSIRQGEFY